MQTAIIFDLDGTLWDATEQMLPAWNRVLKRYTSRQPMTLEEVRSYMGKTVEEIAAAALPTIPEEQRVAIFNQCCIEELPWLTEHPGNIYPQVPQVLRQLEDTVRRLLEVQAMLAEGMSQSAIRAEIKRHEFYVKKLTAQARRLSSDALAHLYCYLVDCDVKSKRTARLDMDAFVEEVIINCCATIAVRGRRAPR